MAEGNALKAMVSFFTIWRRDITEDDMEAMNRKFHLVPVVGALIGIVVMIEAAILLFLQVNGYFGSEMFTAIAILATVFVGSRFLHVDGLADFGDGSVVAGTQEDHVRALKDTLIGAGGLGVALVAILMSFSLYSMAGIMIVAFAAATEVLVKNAQVAAAAFGKAGNGMAGRQVSETTVRSMQVSTVISLVLALVLGLIGAFLADAVMDAALDFGPFSPGYDMDYWAAIAALVIGTVVSVLVGYLMARRCNRVFGMVNGDILGATNEISRIAVMGVMVLVFMLVVRCRL